MAEDTAVGTATEQEVATSSFSMKDYLKIKPIEGDTQAISTSNDLLSALQRHINRLNEVADSVIDQVEKQIADLKGRYRGLEHTLPELDFEVSRMTILDLDQEALFDSLVGDMESIRTLTELGTAAISNNCFAGLLTNRSLVGMYVDIPFGSNDPNQHAKEMRALTNLAELAHQNICQVFLSTDPRQVMGVENFSELPDNLQDLMEQYQLGKMYKGLRDMDTRHQRRICNTFNYFLSDTERLADRFHKNYQPSAGDTNFLDQSAWVSSVFAMCKQISQNFDRYGWGHHIMGKNAIQSVPTYQNYMPIFHQRGLSLGSNLNHRYTMTLYDLLAPDDTETLVKLGFSPLQRQVLEDGKHMEEYIAFTEAQTLLERDDDEESDLNFYNYLGNSLLEDSITRDLVLIMRNFIGSYGSSQENEPRMKDTLEDFLNKLIQPQGSAQITNPLEDYKIERCAIVGQTAKIKIKVLPLKVIRKVQIELENVKGTDIDAESDGGGQN